jgi:hypothetical protein
LLAGQHEKAADKSEPFSRNSNNSKELDQQRSTNQDCKFTKRSWARQEILRLLINRDRKRKLLDRINEQAVISERNFKTTGNASVPSYVPFFGKKIKGLDIAIIMLEEIEEKENNSLFLQKDLNENDKVSERIPQEKFGSVLEGRSRMDEASDVCRRSSSLLASKLKRSLTNGERNELEKRSLEAYAKSKGIWLPFGDLAKLGNIGANGDENNNYYSKDGYVYKMNNLMHSRDSITTLFNKIRLHNTLFPETKYELIGFCGFDCRSVYPIFRQKLIHNSVPATNSEIDKHMSSLGFEKTGKGTFVKGNYELTDLLPKNVLKSENGNVYIVDCEIKDNSNKTF